MPETLDPRNLEASTFKMKSSLPDKTTARPPALNPEQQAHREKEFREVYERLGKAAERYVEILNSSEGWEELDDVMLELESRKSDLPPDGVLLERTLTGWSGGSPEEWSGSGEAVALKEVFRLTSEDAQQLEAMLSAPPEDRKRLAGALLQNGKWKGWKDEDGYAGDFYRYFKSLEGEVGQAGEVPASMPGKNWEQFMLQEHGLSPDDDAFKEPSSMSIKLKRASELT